MPSKKIKFEAFERNRHGSLYDRGAADSYYGRQIQPHWWPEGTGKGERIDVTKQGEIDEYMVGYNWNERHGDKKHW